MMTWNHDISAAPRGRFVERTINAKTGPRTTLDFEPDHLWLALAGGQVMKSFFIPPDKREPDGRWHGCATGQQPIAWQMFVKPEFPAELESAS